MDIKSIKKELPKLHNYKKQAELLNEFLLDKNNYLNDFKNLLKFLYSKKLDKLLLYELENKNNFLSNIVIYRQDIIFLSILDNMYDNYNILKQIYNNINNSKVLNNNDFKKQYLKTLDYLFEYNNKIGIITFLSLYEKFDKTIYNGFENIFNKYKETFSKIILNDNYNFALLDENENFNKFLENNYKLYIDSIYNVRSDMLPKILYIIISNNDLENLDKIIDKIKDKKNKIEINRILYNVIDDLYSDNTKISFDVFNYLINFFDTMLDNNIIEYLYHQDYSLAQFIDITDNIIENLDLKVCINQNLILYFYNKQLLNSCSTFLLYDVSMLQNIDNIYSIMLNYEMFKKVLDNIKTNLNNSNDSDKFKILKKLKNSNIEENFKNIESIYLQNIDKIFDKIKNNIELLPNSKKEELYSSLKDREI